MGNIYFFYIYMWYIQQGCMKNLNIMMAHVWLYFTFVFLLFRLTKEKYWLWPKICSDRNGNVYIYFRNWGYPKSQILISVKITFSETAVHCGVKMSTWATAVAALSLTFGLQVNMILSLCSILSQCSHACICSYMRVNHTETIML